MLLAQNGHARVLLPIGERSHPLSDETLHHHQPQRHRRVLSLPLLINWVFEGISR